MKIKTVVYNNRKRAFVVGIGKEEFPFPYARLEVLPVSGNPVAQAWIDPELGNEAFSYRLKDGSEGTIHADHVLELNRDPGYMAGLLLYKLSLEAQRFRESSGLSHREVIRRLGTSASQYYRLMDPANTNKSLGRMLDLLHLLGCRVDVVVSPADGSAPPRVIGRD